MIRNRALRLASSFALFGGVLALWETLCHVLEVPVYIVPPPSAVFVALYKGLASGLYLRHAWPTLLETVVGFAAGFSLALTLGILIALSRTAQYYIYPYIIMFQSMPKVALAPVIVVWFGLGLSSKVVTVGLITFFPMLVNTIVGLQSTDPERVSLMRSLNATQWQIFRMLRLPNALPFIMAGVEIGAIVALLGAIVAEFVGAERGLGMLLQSMNSSLDVAGQFSILIILSGVGLTINKTVAFIGGRALFWDPSRKARAAELKTRLAPQREAG